MSDLPIDKVLPELLSVLEKSSAVILHAPPGAGKTTRTPLNLLDLPWLAGKKILMLEPRRLAAVNAAAWLAASLGEPVGERVGYSVRFDRKHSARTRLEILTEGLLTRRLQKDPLLNGVGLVIFDEFHERNLHADTALALCLDMQREARPDLKLLLMSATINTAELSTLLPDSQVVSCEGRTYPVAIRYLGTPAGDLLTAAVQATLLALRESEGDILLFLPGGREIRRCQAMLAEKLSGKNILLAPLYGDMPYARQELALTPSAKRKIVLATNIAETSLTIEGIRVVIDSGLSRRSRFDPSTALSRLVTVRVSAAAATQRAGRAGRTSAGSCYRLWSEYEQQTLLAYDPPEIKTADLCELALNLALWGVGDAGSLPWVEPPPPASLAEARSTLKLLGAVDEHYRITSLGRRMAELPLHPRLSRMLLAGVDDGDGCLACDLAAILVERDLLGAARGAATVTACDLAERLDAFCRWRSSGRLDAGVDLFACQAVERVSRDLRRLTGQQVKPEVYESSRAGVLVALAYPDRIAMQREAGSRRYQLVSGRGVVLAERSGVSNAKFIVAAQIDGGTGGEGTVFTASSLDIVELRTRFMSAITRVRVVVWDRLSARVLAREEERLGALLLGSKPVRPGSDEARDAFLSFAGKQDSLDFLSVSPQFRQFQSRVLLLRRCQPEVGWPDISDAALLSSLDVWLGPALGAGDHPGRISATEVFAALMEILDWGQRARLDKDAPLCLSIPSGSRILVDYSGEDGPVLAVKLQELFGLAETPTIAGGRVKLLLHLLSPAGRPMQVTRDLRGFWDRVYPDVKKELKGRYPRHPWPDDPWSAAATRGVKKRQG